VGRAPLPIARPDPAAGPALYLQLAQAIEEAIRAGQIRVGERLPAERELAADLGVSRTTVTGAFQELTARGFLRGHVGRGTVVVGVPAGTRTAAIPWGQRATPLAVEAARGGYVPPAHPDVISFAIGWPDPALYPEDTLHTLLQALPGEAARAPLYAPAPAAGEPVLRETIAAWLGSRGIRVTPDEVLVTTGGQQGLNVLARALLSPGDVVLTETPTYPGSLLAFRWAGAEVVGVPVDHDGVRPDALEEALVRYRPRLVYLIPNFHNPTGAVLSRERRSRVVELAARYRVPLVESDLYGEMYFGAEPPSRLKALDQAGVVVYQGSFSKIAGPGLRVGWLVVPVGAMPALAATKAILDLATAPLAQRLVAAYLGGPHLEPHLAAMRAECRARRDHLVSALRQHCPGLRVRVPDGGYYLWAELPASLTGRDLFPRAGEHGVAVRPGAEFTPDGQGDHHVRLCFAALPPARLLEGARRLGVALDDARRLVEARPPAAAPPLVV
jgi:DNA-binding transcriptional MocR family regulator